MLYPTKCGRIIDLCLPHNSWLIFAARLRNLDIYTLWLLYVNDFLEREREERESDRKSERGKLQST